MFYDAIVLGLGGMGSAAAYQLAARKKRVLGIEQYTSPHNQGSSHGKTRVIRQAYYEDPAYVPLLLRAYELWRQIERETGATILSEVGGLMMGAPDCEVVKGSIASARLYGLEHEILDAREIHARFPAFHPHPGMVALYERKAGLVRPEESVRAHLQRAAALGAELHFQEKVVGWEPVGDKGVRVRTTHGVYEAARLVISPGPWASQMLADLRLPLVVERQVLYWFDPVGGIDPFLPDRFPIFIWGTEGGASPYGFPALDGPNGGVKVAFYRAPREEHCTPETIERGIREAEIEQMRGAIAEILPALKGKFLAGATCMYTGTPDKNFIIAKHPQFSQVSIACGFSGHGFKFCSVVGEILADLAERGETRHDIGLFNPDRLQLNSGHASG
jgi:sarcosine oxidase